jgi:1-acyl-sn-glycerol-3-phosphate acyltransferase
MLERLLASAIILFARAATGVRAQWSGCAPQPGRRVYFANHSSHGDFVLVWAVLPPALRWRTRPVAAADYWLSGAVRRYCGERLFRAVLIDRDAQTRREDPVAVMAAAIEAGSSLILFPEGTRNTSGEGLLPFRSGLYHLARRCAGVEWVPVFIDNVNRVMPKGEFLPVPLLCSVTFGAPLRIGADEGKAEFLDRARSALLALSPARREASP